MGTREDRNEEPGWRDYLVGDPPVEPSNGQDRLDRLDLDGPQRAGARRVWHQVLTWYLANWRGGSVNSMAGNLGWFELRLTRHETCDVFESAIGASDDPIKLVEGQGDATGEALRWKATKTWADLGQPRGASGIDMGARLLSVFKSAFKSVTGRILAFLAAAATIAGAIGWAVKPGTPEARLLVAAGVWLGICTLAHSVLRDERDLAAAARAWPRLKAYRPRRYEFETTTLRTPLPYAIGACATVALAVVAFWTLRASRKHAIVDVTGFAWDIVWVIVVVLAAAIAGAYGAAWKRSHRRRAEYEKECGRRRPGPERGPAQ